MSKKRLFFPAETSEEQKKKVITPANKKIKKMKRREKMKKNESRQPAYGLLFTFMHSALPTHKKLNSTVNWRMYLVLFPTLHSQGNAKHLYNIRCDCSGIDGNYCKAHKNDCVLLLFREDRPIFLHFLRLFST